ncbi:hypothetical protein [Streptomyces natalensis]|uniref:Uncharacterized protein n=1 Tax=Streptomyces natalensis ATCC 27448 TaxID=1240678 RepID=A0A0D7CRV9_9ACTN|nr:hypothetical protein [Streptomyces natalensis]KIZ18766.1 hypothetical protein SNA_05710 [Streptomyces natalensis ATCC 27448]
MVRRSRKPRRLVAGGETYFWSLGHEHEAEGPGRYRGCREILGIRRAGARGRLRVVFRGGAGRLVPDGLLHSGAVGTAQGAWLNLHEPGTVRALLDEAVARGWRPDGPSAEQRDGWELFDAVAARRGVIPAG